MICDYSSEEGKNLFECLCMSLMSHQKEVSVIRRKLKSPHVPETKKEKLKYRKQVLESSVIPKIERCISRCGC